MSKFIKKIINNPLFIGSAILLIGSTSVNILNYLNHLIMGRLLGPPIYGELEALISLSGLLGVIPGSISLVVIKYVSAAQNEEEINNLISWMRSKVFQFSLIFFILIIILSPIIKSFLHIEKMIYIILIAIITFFSIPTLLNRSILQGLLKFKEMIISVLIENGIKFVVGVILVYSGYRVGGAMAGFTLAAIVGWYLTNIYLVDRIRKKTKLPPKIKSMIWYTIPVIIQSIALTSFYSSDLVLVKHFFPSHDAGIYAALSTLGKIILFGSGPIGAVMFPLVSQRYSRGYEYRKIFIYSFLATLVFAIFVVIIYWLFPQFAINLLFGSAYLEATNFLVWFGIFITLFTLSSLLISLHLSLGNTNVVVLPLVLAIAQIVAIWFFHGNLFTVVIISILVTALLLSLLLIYSIYKIRFSYGKKISERDKININNSPGL